MVTGYEREFYSNVARIADAAERIAGQGVDACARLALQQAKDALNSRADQAQRVIDCDRILTAALATLRGRR